jgi:hypothetical protein
MSDDEFTDAQLAMLDQGIRGLGLIDARMALLKQVVVEYADSPRVATGHYGRLLEEAINAVEAWQALAASPFGAMFDPSVIPPDPPDGG